MERDPIGGDQTSRAPGGGASPHVAVPRQSAPPRWDRNRDGYRTGGGSGSGYRNGNRYGYRAYAPHGRTYYNFYTSYPRSYYYRRYPYGYGPAGRGYFYFDLYYNSYVWYPRTVPYDTYYDDSGSYGYPTGELRLQVRPRDAQVFIDGYFAGTVDEFDGMFQSLRLQEGAYEVEIVQPGYEPLVFEVQIVPGERVTYRGDLFPERRP